jgi:hypothetical protein
MSGGTGSSKPPGCQELFDLGLPEVQGFEAVAARLEDLLLPVELLRVETLLAHCRAEYSRAAAAAFEPGRDRD